MAGPGNGFEEVGSGEPSREMLSADLKVNKLLSKWKILRLDEQRCPALIDFFIKYVLGVWSAPGTGEEWARPQPLSPSATAERPPCPSSCQLHRNLQTAQDGNSPQRFLETSAREPTS